MSVTVIVNPTAGRGKARRIFPSVARSLEKLGVEFQAVFTEGPGHAVELTREAIRAGSRVVAACGGDGTVQEVINGLNGSPAVIGFIPCGTGDDLAVNLGIPNEPHQACSTLAEGTVRHIDLARVGTTVYACVAGAGFDSMVNRAANSGVRFLRGTSVYIWSVLKTLAAFKPLEMTVETDGAVWTGRAMFVVAANAASYGGGMKIAPHARMDDGLLDVVIIEELSKVELLRVFPKVFSGSHITHPRVKSLRARKVSLASPRRLELFGDGEYITDLPVTIEVLPAALPVLVPRQAATGGDQALS